MSTLDYVNANGEDVDTLAGDQDRDHYQLQARCEQEINAQINQELRASLVYLNMVSLVDLV